MRGGMCKIKGTVTSIVDGVPEPADRDWLMFGMRALLILCLGGFLLIWRMFSRRSVGGNLLFGYLLFGRGQIHVPVQHFRIRDSSLNVHVVRRKGYMDGHIVVGDEVVAEGHVRDSVLHLSNGWNLTTGTSLRVRRR